MRANAGILIIICLLFLVGTVGANIPDTVTITSDKSYVFAGSGEQSTITVTVTNMSLGVPNAYVNFSVNDPALGTLTPVNFTTGTDGKATSRFKVKTKSGVAAITVGVSDETGSYSNFFNINQIIDHNKAHYATFQHPIEGAVGTNVPFNISFTDFYGNPIDQVINLNQSHTINLHVHGPTPDDCGFVGYLHNIPNQPLDKNGNVSVEVKLTSGAGPNSVTMDQFEKIISPAPRIITAVSSEVFDMEQQFNPDSPPQVPADGASKFTILYTLFDKFRNPASQQEVWVNTSVGGNMKFKTDNLGQISITYGPRATIGVINITATAVNNNTITRSHLVEFTSTAATTMVLTANPEFMPSRDVNPLITSDITATVTDVMGNAVENENVTFSLVLPEQYPGGPYNVTSSPSLPITSAITDANGHATVQFIPGSFSTNSSNVSYSATATGTCTITALWNTSSKNILVTWKNYPYLSVQTSVNPQTVEINKTVDVTISLKADGWAMQPIPIDVVLVMDRSGSMGYSMGSVTRLSVAKTAAKSFVSQMNQSRDRIGLVSYAGSTSGTGTRTDISLSSTYTNVNNKIDLLNALGATETREALKQSIELLKANSNPNPKAIQTIILMTDGDYNWLGTPLGRGTGYDSSYNGYSGNTFEPNKYLIYSGLGCTLGGSSPQTCTDGEFTNQNMSIYAKNNNIRLYMIGFASTLNDQAVSDMNVMANATGGFYQYAPDAATLNQIYTKIAGDLKDTAGVNTTIVTDFQNVNVTGVSVPGVQVYDYVYNSSLTSGSTRITWQNGTKTVTDQSPNWNATHKLDFTIGTMKVGQTWEATFRLKVKKSGSIDIFGTNSFLFFNNGSETLTLPHTFLTVVPDLNTTGFEQQQIEVGASCAVLDPNKAFLPITWTTTYTGGETDIFDKVNYIDDTGAHTTFYTGSYHVTTSTSTTRTTTFDMKTVPQGHYYDIEVLTYTANAQDSKIACGGASYNTTGMRFIKLD